jgi:hypothetical protein
VGITALGGIAAGPLHASAAAVGAAAVGTVGPHARQGMARARHGTGKGKARHGQGTARRVSEMPHLGLEGEGKGEGLGVGEGLWTQQYISSKQMWLGQIQNLSHCQRPWVSGKASGH